MRILELTLQYMFIFVNTFFFLKSHIFSEDFEKERDDRITAIAKLNETEKELKSVKIKLEQTEAELERHTKKYLHMSMNCSVNSSACIRVVFL